MDAIKIKGCLCHRKGNEFWANHNYLQGIAYAIVVVFVTAKVMNFEQITTLEIAHDALGELSLSPQR